jgi:uncharacterized protein YbcC (UPF0753/DUF2309 family)
MITSTRLKEDLRECIGLESQYMEPLFSMEKLTKTIERATKIVSPSWPLKSFVAVNPFWNLKGESFGRALNKISLLTNEQLFFPYTAFLEKFDGSQITDEDIQKAIELAGLDMSIQTFLSDSRKISVEKSGHIGFFTYAEFLADIGGCNLKQTIVDQISKYCSSYFDQGQASFGLSGASGRLFSEWIDLVEYDASLRTLGYAGNFNFSLFKSLSPIEVIKECAQRLNINTELSLELYITKICHNLMGWSSHVAYHVWQEGLNLESRARGTKIEDLVAMYMLYEASLMEYIPRHNLEWKEFFDNQISSFEVYLESLDYEVDYLSIWQRALERSYQRTLCNSILDKGFKASQQVDKKSVQMVFCIDVRSEVLRRNIEKVNNNISTHGFAGFFGVSLHCEHQISPDSSYRCPVLLQPKIKINERIENSKSPLYEGRIHLERFFSGLKQGLASSFLYVELFGFLSISKILKGALGLKGSRKRLCDNKFDDTTLLLDEMSTDDKVETACFALTHLGISEFSKTVIICGHGSVTTNNAFASSLDCGACGGHSGDLNARVICSILNTPEVRSRLEELKNLEIPKETYFIPAVHETVSDEIIILEKVRVPKEQLEVLIDLEATFKKASINSQLERAKISPNLEVISALERTSNWAEVRPEWALAKNACFIVAPRQRTANLDLQGRSFLHDYDFETDTGMKTLELIMTAPMLVTNWINMQYYASSVCMDTYGSGNKVIHNVVGAFGILEGNGGDLRIGLPQQSVHDGTGLVHEPLRLSVFIEAPKEEIEAIVERHETVRDLLRNEWLHLFAIDRENQQILYRERGGVYEALRNIN